VQRYVASGEWRPYRCRGRAGKLAAHMTWITEGFRLHRGDADVVRQDLKRELGVEVTLRTLVYSNISLTGNRPARRTYGQSEALH
jgi:hypothetical protein